MKTHAIEAYNHAKKLYPLAIVLFHLEGRYVALEGDAVKVAEYLPEIVVPDNCCKGAVGIPDTSRITAISRLGEHFKVVTYDYRNDRRERDFPDFHRMEQEKAEDY